MRRGGENAKKKIAARLFKKEFMQKAFIILLALGLDLIFGDPPNRFHPVVQMGNFLNVGRRRAPQRHRFWFGAGWTLAGAALFSIPWRFGACNARRTQHTTRKVSGIVLTTITIATSLKLVLSYRNLRRAVSEVGAALRADNLPEARRLLSWHLVSRDTGQLAAEEVAGAVIESLTENITDGLTAPLLAYAVGGLPLAWGYRFVNTTDSMWGYRNAEFEQLGKFAARLDDLFNWFPARLTGWLLVASAWLTGENGRQSAQTMLAQHCRTTSPNAGWTMAAAAGALEVTLTKQGVYALEGGRQPLTVSTLNRALRLADVAVGLAAASSLLLVFVVKTVQHSGSVAARSLGFGC